MSKDAINIIIILGQCSIVPQRHFPDVPHLLLKR